jgi:hypothetical protein
MENIVLNKVPSNTASPKNIVLDKLPTPPFTAATSAKFAWRPEAEPETEFEELGKKSIGFPANFAFDGKGEIRISMIGVAANGLQSAYDFREGVQTTITIPSVLDTVVTHEGVIVTHISEIVTYSG